MSEKRIWKPFWSFHIQRTEQWIGEMADNGYALSRFQPKFSRFTFTEDPSAHKSYAISFDRSQQHPLPTALAEDNWEVLKTKRKWAVLGNPKQKEAVKTSIVRDQLESRNSKIAVFWWVYFIYIIFSLALQAAIMISLFLTSDAFTFTFIENPAWILTFIMFAVQIGVTLIGIYSLITLKKEAKRLNAEITPGSSLTDTADNQAVLSNKREKKFKFGWTYAPDKLERWLEEKEKSGLHLTCVHKGGFKFQFTKTDPKLYSYCALFEGRSDSGAHALHRESGWERIYASGLNLHQWSIWRKAYTEETEKPEINDDPGSRRQAAMRVAKIYSLMFAPIVLLFALNYFSFILPNALEQGYTAISGIDQFNTIVYPLIMFIFSVSILRAWAYYFRVKKSAGTVG